MKQGEGLQSRSTLSGGNKPLKSSSTLSSGSGIRSKGKRITSKSTTQQSIDKELSKVYEEIDKGDSLYCKGCGSNEITHSHLIPRSKRRDLVIEKENITLHCHDCHDIWEHGLLEEKRKLHDFNNNMEYIKSVDEKYYNQIILGK